MSICLHNIILQEIVVDEVCLYDHGLSHNITYKREQLLMKCVYIYDHGLSHNITYKREQFLIKCVYMIMVSHTILLTRESSC